MTICLFIFALLRRAFPLINSEVKETYEKKNMSNNCRGLSCLHRWDIQLSVISFLVSSIRHTGDGGTQGGSFCQLGYLGARVCISDARDCWSHMGFLLVCPYFQESALSCELPDGKYFFVCPPLCVLCNARYWVTSRGITDLRLCRKHVFHVKRKT